MNEALVELDLGGYWMFGKVLPRLEKLFAQSLQQPTSISMARMIVEACQEHVLDPSSFIALEFAYEMCERPWQGSRQFESAVMRLRSGDDVLKIFHFHDRSDWICEYHKAGSEPVKGAWHSRNK